MTTLRPLPRALVVGLSLAALAAAILLSLPLLGVFAFAARVFALALVPAFFLGVLFVPRVRAWLDADDTSPEAESAPAAGVLFHPSHSWARVDSLDRVKVGADDFAPLVLGPADRVTLPAVGTDVAQGQPLFTVHRGSRRLTLRAPVSGTVVGTNIALSGDPSLLSRAPFGDGWALTLRPRALAREKSVLTPVERAGAWLRGEADRIIAAFHEPGFATMQDGGELADDLHAHLDDEAFRRVKSEIFADRD